MIQFKEAKQNGKLYVLNVDDMTIKEGRIVSASFPRLETIPQQTGHTTYNMSANNSRMVIDFVIDVDGHTGTYAIPENLSITYAGNIIISTEKEAFLKDIEAINKTSGQAIADIERQKFLYEKSAALKMELSPEFREKRETEERFSKIEGSLDELKGMFGDFMRQWNK